MKSFSEIYDAVLPILQTFEHRRLAAVAYASKIGRNLLLTTGGGVIVILAFLAASQSPIPLFGLLLWAIIAGIIYTTTVGRSRAEYAAHFKQQVLQEVVQQMEPGMRYTGADGIPRATFDACGLFDHRSDRYHCDDGFRGTIGKTDVFFSEVHAQYKRTTTDSKGRRKTTYHTFFDGLFMIADFHKEFRTPVLVLPDVAEKTLGFLGKKLQGFRPFSKEKLVYMEDPEFEKHFVVYGSDQVEARYLLSTAMLRRILDLKAKWQDDVRLGFRDSNVQIAISHKQNLFEPNIKKSALDKAQIEQFYRELGTCFEIVEDLNLNTRVWTKE